MDFKQALEDVEIVLDTTDWNQTISPPSLMVKVIEAKAELMRTQKLLKQIVEEQNEVLLP